MSFGFAGIVAAITGLSVRAANQVVIFGVTLVAAHFLAPADFGVSRSLLPPSLSFARSCTRARSNIC